MDIVESFAELLAGFILLFAALFLLIDNVVEPSMKNLEESYLTSADKAVSYNNSISDMSSVHDQLVGKLPGIDTGNLPTTKDSGSVKMYFRAEQFIMLPVVDTDLSDTPGTASGTRMNAVSSVYQIKSPSTRGLLLSTDSFQVKRNYLLTRESLENKQHTYEQLFTLDVNKGPGYVPLVTKLKEITTHTFPNIYFGSQAGSIPVPYGGFNITIDSTRDDNAKSNSVIFVSGRVDSK